MMKTFQFPLLLVSVLLLCAQCQKPEELDIKPQARIIQKWARLGPTTNPSPYNPDNRLELWSDSTYKVFINNIMRGEGTYYFYTKTFYDHDQNPYLIQTISMTGYDVELWGRDWNTYESEYFYFRFIGDSACPPALTGLQVPENIKEIIAINNLSNEVLLLQCLRGPSPRLVFIKTIK